MATLRPQANQYILGVTSLWLLIPGLLGLWRFDGTWIAGGVITLCFVCCGASTLHWQHCVEHSTLHNADRKLAVLFFVTLSAFIYCGYPTRQLPLGTWMVLPGAVALFYIGARYCVYRNWILGNLVCHLMFRFLGYWWTFLVIHSHH